MDAWSPLLYPAEEAPGATVRLCTPGSSHTVQLFLPGHTVADPLDTAQPGFAERYRIQGELGRGGMATVYLAQDLRHDRLVALKVLRHELAHTLGPERFLREIRLAARLNHPNILPVFDSGTARQPDTGLESLWFTMPYVEGESLRQRIEREPQLPLADAVGIALQVAGALSYAHAQGIIHRDVKPENILLSGQHCAIANFGVARALDAAGGERLTESGFALGTPLYMSPEQATADSHIDGRSDIYSLGCVLYEMLAGEPPFTGRTPQAIIARRLSEPVPRLRTIRDVPERVEQVVHRALARSPADRFPDAAQFGQALQAAADPTVAVGVPSSPAPVERHRSSTRHLPLAAVATLVAVAVGAGLYHGVRPRPGVALDPNLLAVAPFDVIDPSLQLWHEGLGDILSRSLDGAGPLRTVSQSVALRQWKGRADRASAAALGQRTGAGLVVFGDVVPKGLDSVTLRVNVLDGTGAENLTDIEIAGEKARVGELADSLTVKGAPRSGSKPRHRIGAASVLGFDLAPRPEGVSSRRTVLPAGPVGFGVASICRGTDPGQRFPSRAQAHGVRPWMESAQRGGVPAEGGIRSSLNGAESRPAPAGQPADCRRLAQCRGG